MVQESEHSRGSTVFAQYMDDHRMKNIQPTTIDSLRTAYIRVVKRRSVHRDFLRVSKEMEERMAESRPSTMFFYGL